MYAYGCFSCLYVCVAYVYLVPMETKRGHMSPASGVTDSCEPLCWCKELNPGLNLQVHCAVAPVPSCFLVGWLVGFMCFVVGGVSFILVFLIC